MSVNRDCTSLSSQAANIRWADSGVGFVCSTQAFLELA
jgi:hypothetical protein